MVLGSMLRSLLGRLGTAALVVATVSLALATTSCGGDDGFAAKDMVLLQFLFVDRALNPTQPTGTQNLPRNAQLLFVFSEQVNPATVDNQTIQVRFGPTLQSVPTGSFSVSGNTVRFDPTVTAQGEPNPFGFAPVTQYAVDVPNWEEQPSVVENLDYDPLLNTFFSSFVTSSGYLRELTPPEVIRVFFTPDPDQLTGQVPGFGTMSFEFTEAMDPATFILGGPNGPDDPNSPANIDVRYDADAQINIDNGLVNIATGIGAEVVGYFSYNPAATIYTFRPTFSFGNKKFVIEGLVKQGLKDLSGNLLINPRSFGPYVTDGRGRAPGRQLRENFATTVDADMSVTDADWGQTTENTLAGQPVTSRQSYIYSYSFVQTGNRWGQYAAIVDPLIGAALNQYVPNITPPTTDGRRVMWAFSDAELGADGSITAAAWGPDSNATFAASYPNIYLRAGYQATNSLSLAPNFSGNYEGTPTVVYKGSYSVAQRANVGNTPGQPVFSHASISPYSIGFNCVPAANQLLPLFDYTGWMAWPTFTNVFDWTEGVPGVDNDRVLIFDASVEEGTTWQQLRGWFAVTYPCSGILIAGIPNRRLYTTYEDEDPNPASNFALGILNPEPSVTDSCFTITKVISLAQTLFYTDGTQVANSVAVTFGDQSNYLQPLLTPSVQQGGAQLVVAFQGADVIDFDRRTINQAAPFMPDFSQNIDDCDGYRCIRWRIQLISNLINGQTASLTSISIPLLDDF